MPNEVISGDFLVAQSDSKLVQINVGLALPRRDYQGQISHAHQIVGSASEGESTVHLAQSAMPHLSHECDGLQPEQSTLGHTSSFSGESVDGVPCGVCGYHSFMCGLESSFLGLHILDS